MVSSIDRYDVQRLLAGGAIIMDVLPEGEYAEEHIAGAVNVPLASLTREATAGFAHDAPVIVYCFDAE